MAIEINITFNENDKDFALLIEEGLNQIIDKNENISFKFSYNNSSSEKNIIVNPIESNIDKKSIVINTTPCNFNHQQPEVDFFYLNIDGNIKTINDLKTKNFWLKIYDLISLLGINLNDNKYIFIAPCSIKQTPNREILIRQFVNEGFNVLPVNNLKQSKEQIEKDLSKSDFSIHILDENFGTKDNLTEYYNKIAADYISKNYQSKDINNQLRFIWISPELSFFDETQQLKLEKFRQDVESLKGAEILQTPIELLKNLLKNRILEGNKEFYTQNTDNNLLYLIHEKNDDVKAIVKQLKNANISIDQLSFSSDLIKEHRKKLVQASDVLIVGNNKNKNWVISKTKDILKAPGFGKKESFKSATLLVNNKSTYADLEKTINVIESDEKEINQFIKSIVR